MPSQAVLARNQNKRTLSPVISEREAGLKAQCIRGAANRCMGMDRDAANTDAAAQQDALRHLEQQLRQRDETISVLQRRLEHFRVWLLGVQAQVSARDPQIIKNARRLYVGGIPEGTKEEELRAFFEGVMASTGAAVAPGPPIASVKVSSDRSYAFLELRSVEEASNAMAFDGILFNDVNLKIRRPSNYNPEEAAPAGPDCPDPCVATAHLAMCKTVVEDTWDKIFVGGLPCNYGDEQVKELLAPYGSLKSFNLVMDKNTGKSKGYAFCEFSDPRVIPQVINGLHMQCLERKVLTVKRALEGNRQGGGSKSMAPALGSASSSTRRQQQQRQRAAAPAQRRRGGWCWQCE
ncbi:hypothetical protein COO60DRAFT_972048 [Scenedesmus sp. NREL 46B-D3]|nr:hypothetical protein COO60DRAFT_972048 [Scenedesmus sp. NREL 46B-D3]